jgi:hypothetical protein
LLSQRPSNPGLIRAIARLLGLAPDVLATALTTTAIAVAGEDGSTSTSVKPLSVDGCLRGRDALARALYHRVVCFLANEVRGRWRHLHPFGESSSHPPLHHPDSFACCSWDLCLNALWWLYCACVCVWLCLPCCVVTTVGCSSRTDVPLRLGRAGRVARALPGLRTQTWGC